MNKTEVVYSRVASQCGDDAQVLIKWPSSVPSRSLWWVRKFLFETCKSSDWNWGVVVPCAAQNSCNSTGHAWYFLMIFSLEIRLILWKKNKGLTQIVPSIYTCCLIKLRHSRSWLTAKPWTVSVPNLCTNFCDHPLNCASCSSWLKPTLNIHNNVYKLAADFATTRSQQQILCRLQAWGLYRKSCDCCISWQQWERWIYRTEKILSRVPSFWFRTFLFFIGAVFLSTHNVFFLHISLQQLEAKVPCRTWWNLWPGKWLSRVLPEILNSYFHTCRSGYEYPILIPFETRSPIETTHAWYVGSWNRCKYLQLRHVWFKKSCVPAAVFPIWSG